MTKVLFVFTATLFLLIGTSSSLYADTIPAFSPKRNQWITPTTLFVSGSMIAAIPQLRELENAVYNGFQPGRKPTKIDDYTQYVPALGVFALDAFGIKGRNKPKIQLLLYAGSNLIGAGVTHSLKKVVNRERPNGANRRSFPSGHTATAFTAAEFLHQEFGHISPWISIAGYTTAGVTGYLRMYNNEHWLGDVLAGAAIGMASTRFIYWANKKLATATLKKKAVTVSF